MSYIYLFLHLPLLTYAIDSESLSKSQKTRQRRKKAQAAAEEKRRDLKAAPHKISRLSRRCRHLQKTARRTFRDGMELSKQACIDRSDTSIFGPRAEAKYKLVTAEMQIKKSIEIVNTVRRMTDKKQIEPDVKDALHDVVFRGKVWK